MPFSRALLNRRAYGLSRIHLNVALVRRRELALDSESPGAVAVEHHVVDALKASAGRCYGNGARQSFCVGICRSAKLAVDARYGVVRLGIHSVSRMVLMSHVTTIRWRVIRGGPVAGRA